MKLLLQPGLFERTVQRAWRNIQARLASNGNSTRFLGMVQLAMAAALSHDEPAIFFQKPE